MPPFPNELLDAGKKEATIAWIRGLMLPTRTAVGHLYRWGKITGVLLGRSDFRAVTHGSPQKRIK